MGFSLLAPKIFPISPAEFLKKKKKKYSTSPFFFVTERVKYLG